MKRLNIISLSILFIFKLNAISEPVQRFEDLKQVIFSQKQLDGSILYTAFDKATNKYSTWVEGDTDIKPDDYAPILFKWFEDLFRCQKINRIKLSIVRKDSTNT